MSQLHVCNAFFEKELESLKKRSLEETLRAHPIALQLQFLPLLFAGANDRILVSDLPDEPDPRLITCESRWDGPVESWGASLAVQEWARGKGASYVIPPWEIVRKVNSKIFSFQETPKLEGAALLENEKEVLSWLETGSHPKVLKSAYGASGNGHFHSGRPGNLKNFLAKEFVLGLPILGEPWVERTFDFSTQWILHKDRIELVGNAQFQNTAWGTYVETHIGKPFGTYAWALEEHLEVAKPLLKKVQDLGFFGHLGLDAYVYKVGNREKLQPIVEINGRKTMSWAGLAIEKLLPERRSFSAPVRGGKFLAATCEGSSLDPALKSRDCVELPVQKRRNSEKPLRFRYAKMKSGLLPSRLFSQGKIIEFEKNLEIRESS